MLAAEGGDAVVAGLDGLPEESVAALVAHLPRGHARRVLESASDNSVGAWLEDAALDDALAIVLHLDDERRGPVLDAIKSFARREALKRLLIYPRTTAGAVVDPGAPRLDAALPLGDALEQLRGELPEPDRTIWLVGAQGRYVGMLDATRALAASSARHLLSELAIYIRPLRADITLVNARDYPEWQRHSELPVVDHLDHFLGSLSRERLLAALGDGTRADAGLADVVTELTQQYFHVMGTVLGELLGLRRAKR